MPDETLSFDSPELETPAIGASDASANDTELDTPAIGEEGAEPQHEEDELEFGFKKYRVPKDLKEGVEKLRAAFTQKTQEYSSRDKELDDRRAQIEQQSKAGEEELSARARLFHFNEQVSKLEALTWEQWEKWDNEDPAAADRARKYLQYASGEKAKLQQTISDAEATRTQTAQQDLAKRVEQTTAWAQTNIKGWSPDMDNKIISFARGKGATDQFLVQNMSPALYEVLHLARFGDEVLKQRAAPKPKPDPEPLETVTPKGTTPSSRPSDKDDIDTWMKKYRKKAG